MLHPDPDLSSDPENNSESEMEIESDSESDSESESKMEVQSDSDEDSDSDTDMETVYPSTIPRFGTDLECFEKVFPSLLNAIYNAGDASEIGWLAGCVHDVMECL